MWEVEGSDIFTIKGDGMLDIIIRWSAPCCQLSYLYDFFIFLRPCSACCYKK